MQVIDVFKTLADESRLRLVHLLSKHDLNVQELTSIFELSQSTISHHLRVLQQHELVKVRKEGTWSWYSGVNGSSPHSSLLHKILELSADDAELERVFKRDLKTVQKVLDRRREHARRYFDKVAKEWKQIRQEAATDDRYIAQLVKMIAPDADLADIGCGSGALLEQICPRRGKTIGIDYSQAMLDEARNNLAERAADVEFRLGYLEHLPIADSGVDLIVACMVLHHIPEPRQVLKDAWRALRKGGRLLVLDLTAHTQEYMREKYADLWLGFNPVEFARWADSAGFGEIDFREVEGTPAVFLLSAKKVV